MQTKKLKSDQQKGHKEKKKDTKDEQEKHRIIMEREQKSLR